MSKRGNTLRCGDVFARRFSRELMFHSRHVSASFLCLFITLPTETNVESGTSQSRSGTSVNLSESGFLFVFLVHTVEHDPFIKSNLHHAIDFYALCGKKNGDVAFEHPEPSNSTERSVRIRHRIGICASLFRNNAVLISLRKSTPLQKSST